MMDEENCQEDSNILDKRIIEAKNHCQKIFDYIWSKDTFLYVKLKEGSSPVQFLSYLIYLLIIFSSFYYLDITMIFLLRDSSYYNLPETEVIETIGNLVFYRSLIRLFFDPLAGSLHDLFSRKKFLICSIFSLIPIFFIITRFSNVYPGLLLVMIFIGIISSNLFTTPILSDLVAFNSLGLSMGMVNLAIDLSRVVAVYIFFWLNRTMSIQFSMQAMGFCLFGLAIYLCFGFKSRPVNGATKNVFKQMLQAIKFINENPILWLYLIYNFISYIFTYLSSTYLTIFITSFFENTKQGSENAQKLLTDIKGVGSIINVVVSGIFGFISDYIPDIPGVVITCILIGFGGIGINFINNVHSYEIYLSYAMIIVGLQSSRVMVFF